ncbi:MAG TPA: P1 family peptidase [Bryobacteraceae bacterium]|nr:P1 family peptidase [Bryobacteraceae bacterium]
MRLRDAGIPIGNLPAGPGNAITDVPGVLVGHATVIRGTNIRTGVTAVLPHAGNLFQKKVPAGIHVGNAFGKLIGSTQVQELGELETPILLTATLNAFRVADALLDYMLALPGNENVRSINPVVGETNDGALNDIRARAVGHDEVLRSIQTARTGPVAEGAVGAGTGTIAFGWKGGIGTSSRTAGIYTVGVLIQSNFGGRLLINGIPMDNLELAAALPHPRPPGSEDGSIMIVVATDAPCTPRNLQRLAARTMLGLGKTGSSASNGSGDYAIAFCTTASGKPLTNDAMSPLFAAVIEATEEAIVNSLTQAVTVSGNGRTVPALPIAQVLRRLRP